MKSILSRIALTILLVMSCSLSFAAEQRVVRVGAFNYYPGIFKDSDGEVKGFYVDALADIAKRENIRFDYIYGSWSEGLERIKSGEVDVLTSVAYTSERAQYLDFARTPLLTVWGELYTALGAELDNIQHVQGKKIAVMKGDFNARHFIDLVGKFNISCEFVEKPGFEEVFKAIATKEVDGGVVNSTFGVAKQKEYSLRSTGVVFNPFDIFFAVGKGKNSELIVLLDKYLDDWRHQEDSVFNQARQKWSHGNTGKIKIIPSWLKSFSIALVALIFVALIFIVLLNNRVHRATADILDSKADLKESEAKFRNYVENSPDGIFVADENGNLVDVNPSAVFITGYSNEDLLEMTILDLVSPEQRELNLEKFQQLKEAGALKTELELLHKSGRHGWILLEAVKLSGTRYLGFAKDITDLKQAERERAELEAQLQQSQKMESVGRLAGGVAHDFNNMLGVILGHADMALLEMDPSNPFYGNFEEIQKAAERSAELTRQLLAFARKQTVDPKVLDLNEIISDMLKMLQRLIGEDINLNWRPEENLWQVKVDPSQIDQILANLCVNARDSIAGVGNITIEVKNISVDMDYCNRHADFETGEYVRLSVSDDGCGMTKELLTHIFEPFFTTKGVGEGTGLGLSTVYGAVKQNNGYVNVYSEPGIGTTFATYLPRHVDSQEQKNVETITETVLRGHETILVVEDEDSILRMITMMLEKQGYTVLAAGSSEEAFSLAGDHAEDISILITDVVMPVQNGRDLAKQMLLLYPHLKILFMSGYTADVIAKRGVLDLNVNYIQKPFSIMELAAKVREVLN